MSEYVPRLSPPALPRQGRLHDLQTGMAYVALGLAAEHAADNIAGNTLGPGPSSKARRPSTGTWPTAPSGAPRKLSATHRWPFSPGPHLHRPSWIDEEASELAGITTSTPIARASLPQIHLHRQMVNPPLKMPLHRIFRFRAYHGGLCASSWWKTNAGCPTCSGSLIEDGHAVTVALDGREGSPSPSPALDLLLLDVMLPASPAWGSPAASARAATTPHPHAHRARCRQRHRPRTRHRRRRLPHQALSFEVLLARPRCRTPRPYRPIRRPRSRRHLSIRPAKSTRRENRLTRTEYAILDAHAAAGRVLTRESLIDGVWGGNSEIESNTLDAFVRLLRGKIEAVGESRVLRTVRGVGLPASEEP